MADLTHVWRPKPELRALSIGLVTQGRDLLASVVTHDDGSRKGWRPLGGGIEFGETAESALRREFAEEIGATLAEVRQIGVLENLFEHHGEPGHELIVLFHATLDAPGQARDRAFIIEDGPYRDEAGWVDMTAFLDGRETLLPDGLVDWLAPLLPT